MITEIVMRELDMFFFEEGWVVTIGILLCTVALYTWYPPVGKQWRILAPFVISAGTNTGLYFAAHLFPYADADPAIWVANALYDALTVIGIIAVYRFVKKHKDNARAEIPQEGAIGK